jgi:LPS-assembly lipoprotein
MWWFKRAAALVTVLAVAGCGFQMRGQPDLPVVMAKTYIATPDRQSLFYRKLAAELRNNGVQVVDSPLDAGATLNIIDDETGQRVISVSARNIPREYEVFYRIIYSVQNGTRTMLEPQEQTVARDYTYDETLVLGKSQEEDLIRAAIADDLVRLVMFQLAAL